MNRQVVSQSRIDSDKAETTADFQVVVVRRNRAIQVLKQFRDFNVAVGYARRLCYKAEDFYRAHPDVDRSAGMRPLKVFVQFRRCAKLNCWTDVPIELGGFNFTFGKIASKSRSRQMIEAGDEVFCVLHRSKSSSSQWQAQICGSPVCGPLIGIATLFPNHWKSGARVTLRVRWIHHQRKEARFSL